MQNKLFLLTNFRQAVVAPQQSLSVVQLWNACLHALADMDAVDAIITARKKERIVWCVLDLETESVGIRLAFILLCLPLS
jgi:hypothetical protein